MNLCCRIFVSEQGVETREAATDLKKFLGERLAALLSQRVIAGYEVVALSQADDFLEEDIDREIVESVTGGRLPAVYVNLTYDLDEHDPDNEEITSLLSARNMTLALSYPT